MTATTSTAPAQAAASTGKHFPWAGQPDETACNYAFGRLSRDMPVCVANKGKMHAPTLMAAAGAIAGVCAQISLLADAERITKARDEEKIMEARIKDGRTFLFGDALNAMLYSVNDVDVARSRVWNMMVSAALLKGFDRNELPNVPAMFKHVGESFGTDKEGLPSVPANAQPIASVRDLLRIIGPVSFSALNGQLAPTAGPGKPGLRPNRKSWVAISAQAAANMLLNAVRVMPAELCLTIGMESAIYASKLRVNASDKAAPAAEQPAQA